MTRGTKPPEIVRRECHTLTLSVHGVMPSARSSQFLLLYWLKRHKLLMYGTIDTQAWRTCKVCDSHIYYIFCMGTAMHICFRLTEV